MNPLYSKYNVSYGSISSGTDEAEALQTDVMRFMAILCICLMIIFALVKSLPMVPPDTPPVIETPEQLPQTIQTLLSKIKHLQTELTTLRSDVKGARNKREAAIKSLSSIKEEIIKSKEKLTSIQKELKKKSIPSPELKKDVKNEKTKLMRLKTRLTKIKQQKIKKDKNIVMPSPVENTKPKGFILRFASDAALTSLIIKGDIHFFAITGKKAWQLGITGNRTVYKPSFLPSSFYEMAPHTVPESYIKAFENAVAVFGRNVTWGVTLPKSIENRINLQMMGKTGGALVIQKNGMVNYHTI